MRQIVVMGGGGFSEEPENPLLDQYVLSVSDKSCPKICFIPTASGDSEGYCLRFYDAFFQLDCVPTSLRLFRPPEGDLRDFVMSQDILYVGGGNTRNLLVLWKEWGLDKILFEAYEEGKVLAGISAGCICWFEQGLTDSITGKMTRLDCLGILEGSACPHYTGELQRRPSYTRKIASGEMAPGYALDDCAALHFVDGELRRAISSRPSARAYRVDRENGRSVEHPLDMVYLGSRSARAEAVV